MENGIWNKNIEALSVEYENLKAVLQQKRNTDEMEENDIEVGVSDVADKKVLYAVKNGETVQLDTLYSSDVLVDLWMTNESKLGYMTKCIFFGLGNGMYIRKILKEADSSVRVLIYEPSFMLFQKVLEEFDLVDILRSNRVTIIVEGYCESSFKEYIYQFVDFRDLDQLIYQSYPNYDKLFSKEVKEIDNEIQLMYNSIRATQSVMARYGEYYYKNTLLNSVWMMLSKSLVSLSSKIPKDIPVFLVASGPSLDKNIVELANAKGKGLIFAVDSAIPALLEHNIIPDLCISVDGMKNAEHFEDEISKDIPLVCELISNHKITREHRGMKFFVNDLNPYINEYLEEKNRVLPMLSTGGSVANTAFSLVSSMGFQTIVLVGQDLSYSEGKTHAKSTVRGKENVDVAELDGYLTEGYYHEQVKTSYEFQLYHRWFEEQITDKKSLCVINATEGGVYIKGAVHMPLREVVINYCTKEVDISEYLMNSDAFIPTEEREEFEAYIYGLGDRLRGLQRKVVSGLREYYKIEDLARKNKINGAEITRLMKSSSQLVEQIEQDSAIYYIQNRIQAETTKLLSQVYSEVLNPRDEILRTVNQGIAYLKIVESSIQESIPDIKRILDIYIPKCIEMNEN